MRTPRRPEGRGEGTAFFQWVWDMLAKQLRFADSPTVKWSRTTNGMSAHCTVKGGSGAKAKSYRLKEKIGDVLVCRTWDGTTEGTEDVYVAVNDDSRQLDTEVTDIATFTYTDYTPYDTYNDTRNSNDGTDDELQIVTPLYYLNCPIRVLQTDYSGVEFDDTINPPYDLKLIETSSRCWAKLYEP